MRNAAGLITAALALAACTGGGGSTSASSANISAPASASVVVPAAPAQAAAPAAPAAMPSAMGEAPKPPAGGATVTEMAPANPSSGGVPAVPGSLADDTLRGDVLRAALTGSSQLVPGCDTGQAVQTLQIAGARVTQPPQGSGPWQEVWPLSMCGELRMLQIDFTPSPNGGTDYNIHLMGSSRG